MLIVDVEATGSDLDSCSIIELAALDFNNPSNIFNETCKPFEGATFADDAMQMLETTPEKLINSDRQSIESMMNHFMEWMTPIDNRTFSGAYVTFDIAMFKIQLRRMKKDFSIGYSAIELNSLVYAWALKNKKDIQLYKNGMYLGVSATLKENFVGLTIDRKVHTAIEDVKLTAEIINRILYGKNLLPEYKGFPLPSNFIPLV